VREYQDIISEQGRNCLGHPYIACFKTCIAMIARGMNDPRGGFYPEDQFAVVLDRNIGRRSRRYFLQNERYDGFSRSQPSCDLHPGIFGRSQRTPDRRLIAYDTFKLLHGAKGAF